MYHRPGFPRATALALALCALPVAGLAQASFPEPTKMTGAFRVTAEDPGQPIFPGSTAVLLGSGFAPGQEVTLQRGTQVLTDSPLVADEAGNLRLELPLPAEAAVGMHPLVVLAENPSATELLDLKISPEVPLSGEAEHEVTSVPSPAPGLYQVRYSAKAEALFVTASSFQPPAAAILKLDPETLEVLAKVTPAAYPPELRDPDMNPRFAEAPAAAFGLGLDETRGRIWVTNTPSNSLAVYDRQDLSLVKQFPQGQVYHSREVLVDEARGRAYVTSSATAKVHVFDAESLDPLEVIEIPSTLRGENFYVMNLALDEEGGRLFVSSRATSELAVIDAESGEVSAVYALPGAIHATGLAFDPASGHVFVTGQGSDDVLVVDPATGEVLHDIPVGAGALSVAVSPETGLAWVANRGAGTITAVSAEGQIAANLPLGSYPNDVTVGPDGTVYAVNKSLGPDDARGDLITAIRPR